MAEIFEPCPDRRSTESVKWRYYGEDVLPMWVADMDFPSPEPVIQALRQRVEHGVFGYPQEPPELRQVIVERMWNLYRWRIDLKDLVFIPGVVTGFNLACHAFSEPGGGVLVQTPVYPPMLSAPKNAGMLRQEMELDRCEDGSYRLDLNRMEAAIDDKTRLFLLCNPHNPVGKVFTRTELSQMAEICLRRGVVICSDEIHCDLVFSGYHHIPIASLDPVIAQNTITLMAPSKTYNIAGLDCSVAIIQNQELRERFNGARKGLVGGVNVMGWVAALAAYREGQPWLDGLLAYLECNRNFLVETLHQEIPAIQMGAPEGTYLAWLDCREAGIPGNPYQFFLEKAQIALNDGDTFGRGGAGFVRLNFGCPRSMLEEALDRMKMALNTI